ncbi:ZinT family metal-binding protein [Salibacterium halotolerans]|uniref:Zinc transport system substrate-binding protein n=1 Tax=Salibacterium halotolerans TaxID=1884432 RepID=A0A1I5U0H6_9BACI|nr:metal-binding protein ZinT [Salibacterium halotolerans]SFP88783.1 zinc transport system substrate-binding protein [Salibacterium halotolerans]
MKTLLKCALFVFAVGFILAGCGQGSDSSGESASGSESTESAETKQTSGSSEESESSNSSDSSESSASKGQSSESGSSSEEHSHNHDHSHNHSHGEGEAHNHSHGDGHSHSMSEEEQQIYNGWFEDSQVKDRSLSDWEGDWQSVYPYLQDGTLDEVFSHKAEEGERTAEGYKEYYTKGYKTDVNRIVIEGQTVTFYKNGEEMSADYAYDGYEILEYEAGNRGVRYIFKKEGDSSEAPGYIQFSDHGIAPKDAYHFHLYWGDDRQALLDEVTNWPTYYPSDLSGEEIVQEMKAH